MSYNVKINSNDVSNWVLDMGEIPYIARNDDYSLIADRTDIEVSIKYGNIYEKNDIVNIYSGSTVIFNGYIEDVEFKIKSLSHKYTVAHVINSMKDFTFDYATMNSTISAYEAVYDVCNNPTTGATTWRNTFIPFDYLVQALFDKIGFTLDWTNRIGRTIRYYQAMMPTRTTVNYLRYDQGAMLFPATIQDLIFYKYQLWCVNQTNIYNHGQIEEEQNRIANKISLWELLDALTRMAGYIFIPKNETSYYVTDDDTFPTRNYQTEEDYSKEDNSPIANGVKMAFHIPYHWAASPVAFKYNNLPFMKFPGYGAPPNGLYYLDGDGYGEYNEDYYNYNLWKDYVTYDGSDHQTIDWLNHLIPYVLEWNATDSTYYPWIVFPRAAKQSVLRRSWASKMGSKVTEEYENTVNLEIKSINENYITIDELSSRMPYSKIKIQTIDIGY